MNQPITHQWSGKLERTGSGDQTSQRCTRCGQFAVNSGEFCVAPIRKPTVLDFLRLEVIDWTINHVILPLSPMKTNDGRLIVQHIHSLASHRMKETPVDRLDWSNS